MQHDRDEILAWIAQRAHPLTSCAPLSGLDDIRWLGTALEGTRIVGLGEATHGSREFFQLKHRLIELLVEELGVRVFMMEASASQCVLIDDYIAGRAHDGAAALDAQGFWVWNTEEVRAMLDWMRERNCQVPPGDRLHFVGIDCQYNARAHAALARFLKHVDPNGAALLGRLPLVVEAGATEEQRYGTLESVVAAAHAEDPAAREHFETVRRGFSLLAERMAMQADQWRLETSGVAFEEAAESLDLIRQYIDAYAYDTPRMRRDRHMAENVRRVIERYPDVRRFAVWAHNGHVMRTDCWRSEPTMGQFLSEWYGREYYAIGFAFLEGALQARDRAPGAGLPLVEFVLGPPEDDTMLESILADTNTGDFLLDLRGHHAEEGVARWLASEIESRNVGSTMSSTDGLATIVPFIPGADFDGLAFVRRTTRARPNPSVPQHHVTRGNAAGAAR